MRNNLPHHSKQGGVTLAEVLVVIAIIGILAAIAVPSYRDTIERNQIKRAAEALKSDLQWMRAEVVKRSCASTNNWISFDTSAWSYSIYRQAGTCDCPTGSNCLDRTTTGTDYPGITMTSAAFGASSPPYTGFDFRRGTARLAGNVRFSSANYTVKVVVSTVGRVQICNIAGSTGLPGYSTC